MLLSVDIAVLGSTAVLVYVLQYTRRVSRMTWDLFLVWCRHWCSCYAHVIVRLPLPAASSSAAQSDAQEGAAAKEQQDLKVLSTQYGMERNQKRLYPPRRTHAL